MTELALVFALRLSVLGKLTFVAFDFAGLPLLFFVKVAAVRSEASEPLSGLS